MVYVNAPARRNALRWPDRVKVLACWLALTSAGPATADAAGDDPLILVASNVSNAAVAPLVPVCSRVAGVEVRARYANNPAVADEIERGIRYDVAVLETGMLRDLAAKGLVDGSSVRPLASLPMGIATSEPGPVLRTQTVAAFKRALLGARSIGYAEDGHSGAVFLGVVDRLGLRDALSGKLEPYTGGYAGASQASRHTQFIIAPFFKPLPAPLRLIGYFPSALDADVDVSAGAAPTARPEAAAFLSCLRSPAARAEFNARGYRVDR